MATVRRVVVGLSGLGPRAVDDVIASVGLPYLARIGASGGSSRIATASLGQASVAWRPTRQPRAIQPLRAVSLQGQSAWHLLSDASVLSAILHCSCSCAPDESRGRKASGTAVPNIRGGLDMPTSYPTSAGLVTDVRVNEPEHGGQAKPRLRRLRVLVRGVATTPYGPR